jgi:tetratricopeptide (TPR) repeat protein
LDILPGDTEAAIVVAPALRKAGKVKEAEALVQRVLAYQEKLLETYPESPLIHNSIAWLLGRTRTDLDRALVHAKKAAEKSPRSTAILDTLAEVHFQRGERELAIEAMGRCLKLEPENQRHRRAMDRYRTKGPETEPPPEEMFDWGEG